jgi:RNA polymerase sigma-70 factor (ECF subfamily)
MTINCAEKSTIEWLYKKLAPAAIAKAASIVRRPDIGAEIAHDTFIKLWQYGGQFPNEKAVYSWIYKTCHHAAIDYLRSAGYRHEDYSQEDLASFAGEPSASNQVLSQQLIHQYISLLTPQEAEAFLYAELDGMTQIEIAEIMGLSRRTVQRLLEKVDKRFQEQRRHESR